MRIITRIGIFLFLIIGCNDKSVQPVSSDPYDRWKSNKLHNYSFDQVRHCFCPEAEEVMRVTVVSDTISVVKRLSDNSILPRTTSRYYKTIESLFKIIKNPGDDSLVVIYNATYGYPEKLDINPQMHPVDGGVLYETSNLEIP